MEHCKLRQQGKVVCQELTKIDTFIHHIGRIKRTEEQSDKNTNTESTLQLLKLYTDLVVYLWGGPVGPCVCVPLGMRKVV